MSRFPTSGPSSHAPPTVPPSPPRRLSANAMPSPIATSTNRTSIIGRSSHSSLGGTAPQPATGLGRAGHASQHTYSKPFPVPNYLRHSSYHPRFFTTPPEPSLFGARAGDPEAAAGASLGLSDALGLNAEGSAAAGGGGSILLPTCWDEGDKCNLIELSTDGLGVNFAGECAFGSFRRGRSAPKLTPSLLLSQAQQSMATEMLQQCAPIAPYRSKQASTTTRSPSPTRASAATSVRLFPPSVRRVIADLHLSSFCTLPPYLIIYRHRLFPSRGLALPSPGLGG